MVSFNSRTCEGATTHIPAISYTVMVSIHAPVKVRLAVEVNNGKITYVSIHAPVKVRRLKATGPSQDE